MSNYESSHLEVRSLMELIRHFNESFLQIAEGVLNCLDEGFDYSNFEVKLKDMLDGLGRKICQDVLQHADELIRKNRAERAGWNIERRDEQKNILTPFGAIEYKRTYFVNKDTKQYAHLVDLMAGHGPHARIDCALSSLLAERAVESSYRKSGAAPSLFNRETHVSGQTVMNTLRSFSAVAPVSPGPAEKRKVRFLYIEADEDHVAAQKGRNMQVYLVYVHEGKEERNGRRQLINPRYFAGCYDSTEDLWYEVADYIAANYDLNSVEQFFIAGDGAAWIKSGLEIIPNSSYVLDRFHLAKYITHAAGSDKSARRAVWRAIKGADIVAVDRALQELKAARPEREAAILKCWQYIKNNWEGIEAYENHGAAQGCSAEGHVSHILSARLSSRPRAWSKAGANQMAKLRVMQANGRSVREQYLAQVPRSIGLMKVAEETVQAERRKLKKAFTESLLDNLPALRGKSTFLTKALRGLCHPA